MAETQTIQQENRNGNQTEPIPNSTTLVAMKEAIELANDPNVPTFSSVKDLMAEFEK